MKKNFKSTFIRKSTLLLLFAGLVNFSCERSNENVSPALTDKEIVEAIIKNAHTELSANSTGHGGNLREMNDPTNNNNPYDYVGADLLGAFEYADSFSGTYDDTNPITINVGLDILELQNPNRQTTDSNNNQVLLCSTLEEQYLGRAMEYYYLNSRPFYISNLTQSYSTFDELLQSSELSSATIYLLDQISVDLKDSESNGDEIIEICKSYETAINSSSSLSTFDKQVLFRILSTTKYSEYISGTSPILSGEEPGGIEDKPIVPNLQACGVSALINVIVPPLGALGMWVHCD